MSAVVVVTRRDAVVAVADRAAVTGARIGGRGTAPQGPAAPKLGTTAGGCLWALAGQAAVGTIDVRPGIAGVTDTSPLRAAGSVRAHFAEVGADIAAGAFGPAAPHPLLMTQVHTVAVIAGVDGGGAEAFLVAITSEGDAVLNQVYPSGVEVLAPDTVFPGLLKAGEAALAASDPAAAADLLVEAVRAAALAEPDLITLDVDVAVVAGGQPITTTYRPPPPPVRPLGV